MNNLSKHLKICLVTSPLPEIQGGQVLVENFLHVLEPLSKEIYLVTGNYPQNAIFSPKIHLRNIKHSSKRQSALIRAARRIIAQLKLSYNLAKVTNKTDIVIFFLAAPLLLPMLVAKLRMKKTILITTGLWGWSKSVERDNNKSPFDMKSFIFPRIISLLEKLNYRLTDRLVVYSPSLIRYLGLEKYKNKIYIAHKHFLDFDKFKIKKQFDERENLVGYIGRLSEEKGVLNFVKAIPMVSGDRCEIRFLIGGDGPLRDTIERYLDEENLNDKIELTGWIPHDELPDYLNELKLVVLPSYTEGLPNVMLEAMACGTPVLATPVGAIPDIIKDGETGFVMKNNLPECIAENVMSVLEYPDLEGVVRNAKKGMEEEYTYDAAVARYRRILEGI